MVSFRTGSFLGHLVGMNPLRSARLAPARVAIRGRRDWALDLRHLPHHLAEIHRRAPSQRDTDRLRLFNIDLHIGPIGDFRAITTPMGVDLTDWTISGHADVIGRHREPVLGFNAFNWSRLSPRVVDMFLKRYGRYLDQFDGFVTTHTPAFATLFLRLEKPIIALCSTRYERPFTDQPHLWHWLDEQLRKGAADGQLHFVANNVADGAYLRHFTGIASTYIPSLCSYTYAPYAPRDRRFAIASKSAMCTERIREDSRNLARPIAELLPARATWQERHSVRGWVHVPYNISQMAIFEQYWENVPIYIPDDDFLLRLWQQDPGGVLNELSMYQVLGLPTDHLPEGDPNRVHDPDVIRWWLEKSDYGPRRELSEIVRFASFEHLSELLATQDDEALSERIRQSNIARRSAVVAAWEQTIESVWGRS
ncbi:MAG: hypothetical protein ACYCST_15550 [Acidimicrobiales bacterium]